MLQKLNCEASQPAKVKKKKKGKTKKNPFHIQLLEHCVWNIVCPKYLWGSSLCSTMEVSHCGLVLLCKWPKSLFWIWWESKSLFPMPKK